MLDALLERDLLPDPLIRFGIRRLLAARLRRESTGGEAAQANRVQAFVEQLRRSPIALATDAANEQHYEVPTEFFKLVLGRRLKYSSAYWPAWAETLDLAEEAMLEMTSGRARLADGQEILELGCGWGSLTLYMAERYPKAKILAVSNSRSQQEHVRAEASRRELGNVELLLADMNDLRLDRRFDRVVSVEMFEHMRNYERLFEKIAGWMRPEARLFVHIFCHRCFAYPFEDEGPSDWMARHFFTGGLMPSVDLLERFASPLQLEERWLVGGEHYQKTALAWLANMDRRREAILPILEKVYGSKQRIRWWVYWRVFFLACAELFGYRGGEEWLVGHYLFRR